MYRFHHKHFDRTSPRYLPWWKRSIRRVIHRAAHLSLRFFTRTTIAGGENIPSSGPYIVAGNHRGIMEVAVMLAAIPDPIDIIGAGDIPLDRRYRYFAHWYGFIPYHRGLLDRKALQTARAILEAGGVVGIFPEGGIWKTSRKGVQRGVGWLSLKTGAPVVPVGFGGVTEGIHRTITFQHPRFEAHIGPSLFPEKVASTSTPRKAMEEISDLVMTRVDHLVPEWDRDLDAEPFDETYEFELYRRFPAPTGKIEAPEPTRIDHELFRPELLAAFLHLPVLLNTLYFNLKRRGVRPLRRSGRWHDAGDVRRAVAIVLGYVTQTNPAYLPYRLGSKTSQRLERSLRSLHDVAETVAEAGGQLRFIPVKRIQQTPTSQVVEERHPPRHSRRL